MSEAASFAVTFTIKDEARMLPDALRWYRALGAARFYIFLDGTGDAMRDWLPTQGDVVVRKSVTPSSLVDPPPWIGEAASAWHHYIDARKNLNSWIAARDAAADGITWLAMFDPDELLIPDVSLGPSPDALAAMLQRTPDRADQILVRNCDVVAGAGDGTPFGHLHFLARRERLETVWRPLRKALLTFHPNPDAAARFDHAFWRLTLRDRLPRQLIDPESGTVIPAGYFLSYGSHKSIFRTTRVSEHRPVIHQWKKLSGRQRAKTDPTARLLHFDLPDAQQFIHKFSQRRGHREFTPLFFTARRRLTQIASLLPPEEATRFFTEQIAIGDPQRMQELVEAGIVHELPQVRAFFAEPNGIQQ